MEVESGNNKNNKINFIEEFFLKKNFQILLKNLKTPEIAEEIYKKLFEPNNNVYDIVKNIQHLSEETFYSYKNITTSLKKNYLLFVCSSISPIYKKSLNNSDYSKNTTGDTDNKTPILKNKKRENCESCPLKLKFKFNEITKEYKISKSSYFFHNHPPICNN
jgi:hypothetical protein